MSCIDLACPIPHLNHAQWFKYYKNHILMSPFIMSYSPVCYLSSTGFCSWNISCVLLSQCIIREMIEADVIHSPHLCVQAAGDLHSRNCWQWQGPYSLSASPLRFGINFIFFPYIFTAISTLQTLAWLRDALIKFEYSSMTNKACTGFVESLHNILQSKKAKFKPTQKGVICSWHLRKLYV